MRPTTMTTGLSVTVVALFTLAPLTGYDGEIVDMYLACQ